MMSACNTIAQWDKDIVLSEGVGEFRSRFRSSPIIPTNMLFYHPIAIHNSLFWCDGGHTSGVTVVTPGQGDRFRIGWVFHGNRAVAPPVTH
jgi:hypothetical protein